MADFKRPESGFRFEFRGVNLRSTPDAIDPNKYASALNLRQIGSNSIRTRPGYTALFACGSNAVTDLASYAAIGTDFSPRFLARDAVGGVYLDNGNLLATLATPAGFGASMRPFRPGASPQAWMYVAAANDYQKFSAPANNNAVTVYKVGIAEPGVQLEAAPLPVQFLDFSGNNNDWVASGNVSVTNNTWANDTVTVALPDPVVGTRYSIEVSVIQQFTQGMLVSFNNSHTVPIQDVIPAIPSNNQITIQSVRYNSGNTGNCTIVTNPLPIGEQYPTIGLGNLRRGAILQLGTGNNNVQEEVFVQSATEGLAGSCSFVCSTVNTHAANENVNGRNVIVVDGSDVSVTPGVSNVILAQMVQAVFTGNNAQGVATISRNVSPFVTPLSGGNLPTEDDYIHVFLYVTSPQILSQVQLIFNVGTASDYTTNVYQYTLTGTNPQNNNTFDALINLLIPISSLTKIGGDATSTLDACSQLRVALSLSGNTTVWLGAVGLLGGALPDVGNNGAPYQYKAIPRGSVTGAQGNPTPTMRYGVSPRRQQVKVNLPSAAYDAQIDTWDVYRYGGSLTSYRYLGSVASGNNANFTDKYFDDTAAAGVLLPVENFEPWPSIDAPFKVASNNTTTITVQGTWITVTGPTTWPATIARWLPGTIVLLNGQTAYTLRSRPVASGNNSYIFETVENAGNLAATLFWVNEPNVARQPAPYMWGPDANGFFFAVGDTLRPGVVYWSTAFAPDEAPDTNSQELCPPSEPLLGGEVIDGLAYVASSSRWWAMYPSGGGVSIFAPLERPVGRGLASPYGICTDKQAIWFWAKDCIAEMAGSGYKDLTSQDLYGLFPREGVPGKDVTRFGVTYYAPDYSRAAGFRLAYVNGYLKADYLDTTGTQRSLVLDLKTGGWCQDQYAHAVTCRCAPAQPSGSTGSGQTLYQAEAMGAVDGEVFQETDNVGDAGASIAGALATFEWNGGDQRAVKQWGDAYLDCLAPAGLTAQPVSLGVNAGNSTAIAISPARQFAPISVGGQLQVRFLGLYLTWTDDYTTGQAVPTTLYLWQPSFVERPEDTQDRIGDWDDFGVASYVRGFVLLADTSGDPKLIGIRSADDNSLRTQTVVHAGEQEIAYYFGTPFVSHRVRYEPQDLVNWRYFRIEWIKDAWPELTNLDSPWMNLGTPKAKFVQGFVIPLDTNGPVKLLGSPAALAIFQPHRTMCLAGTNRTGAWGAMVAAGADEFTIKTIFRDQADFCKLFLYDADDFYGQWQTTKYLPVNNLNGCVLSFDVAYTGLFPLESQKFASFLQNSISVWFSDATAPTSFSIQPYITATRGAVAAKAVYTVVAGPAVALDRVQIWYLNIVFDFIAVGGEKAPAVAANLVAAINAENWTAQNVTMALFAEQDGADIDIWAACYGTVNTVGTAVTWATGQKFFTLMAGAAMQINGVVYRIKSVDSPTGVTLTTSAGTQNGVGYLSPGHGVDGNSIAIYVLHKTSTLLINPAGTIHMTGGVACSSVSCSINFTGALGSTPAGVVRQVAMVFAPALRYPADNSVPALAAYADTACTAVFSNVVATGAPTLKIAGPGSVRAGSATALYTGPGWAVTSGFYYRGFAKICATAGSTVTSAYNCQQTHNLYLGTVTNTDAGQVNISIDGGTAIVFDGYTSTVSPVVVRRLIASGLRSGIHSVKITMAGAKNAASTGYNFTFDFLEAAVETAPAEVGFLSAFRNAATDYDTAHGSLLPPARLVWIQRMLGLTGDWNHYIGAYYWPNRVRSGGTFNAATVTFTGAFSVGDGAGGGAVDVITITIGGTAMSKTVYPQDTNTTIAAHFAYYVNETFVGVRATSSSNVLTITVLSPINGFTISKTFVPQGGSTGVVTLAGSLVAAAEGTWRLDPANLGLNVAASAWHADFLAVLAGYGMPATVAFSQELAGTPDNPPGAVWKQRFQNNAPVSTGTFLGTDGVGYITAFANNNVTMAGHGYSTGDFVNDVAGNGNGQWQITVANNNVFALTTPVGAVVAPTTGDTINRSWQSDQMAFSNNVSAFVGAGHLAVANLYGALGLTPRLQMGEIEHWFFSSDKVAVASLANNGGLIQVNCSAAHGWGNNYYAIVPIFDSKSNPVHPNAWQITVGNNTSFTLQGSVYAAGLTAGGNAYGGSMGLYDADQTAQANNTLGRSLVTFYTQDDPVTGNNANDALFLTQRITAYQAAVQASTLAAYPAAVYELLWPEDVNRPGAPFWSKTVPVPEGGRLNAFINLPASWKQQAGSGFAFFKCEALAWSATYNSLVNTVAAIGFSTSNLAWTAAQSRYLIGWFNGNCYWPTEYLDAAAAGFDWVGFFALDQLCLLSWALPLSDAVVSGVAFKLVSSDGPVAVLPAVATPAAEKTSVAYSLPAPMVAHQVQLQPQGPVRAWYDEAVWIFEETPEFAKLWQAQNTAFGMTGYVHVQKVEAAWASTAPVTLTFTAFDGTSPGAIVLPATGGAYQKQLFFLSFNKGLLYAPKASSSAPFQLYLNDFRVHVKQWGSAGPYVPYTMLGGRYGDQAGI